MRGLALCGLMCVVGGACSTLSVGIPYEAPSMAVPADQATLVRAAREEIRARGWREVAVSPAAGRVEALAPEECGEGVVTRQRWVFDTRPGQIRVRLVLEMKGERDQRWESADEVCSTYEYSRERAVLASLAVAAKSEPRATSLRLAGR